MMSLGLIVSSYILIIVLTSFITYAYINLARNKYALKASKDPAIRKKLEFTQKLIIILAVITVIFISLSYILAFMGKETVEGLSTSLSGWLFSLDGIVVLIYGIQNCVRAFSADKYVRNKTDLLDSDKNIVDEEIEEEVINYDGISKG